MTQTKTSGRLGTRLRGKLATTYGLRGHQNSDLWYVYSPLTDQDWVLPSGLCFNHFVLTEADSTAIDADYSPERDIPSLGPVKFAAVVRYGDGAVQWHHVSSESAQPKSEAAQRLRLLADAAAHAGAQLVCFDERSLYEHEMRLWNWKRAIAWMTAARGTALAPYMTELAVFIHRQGVVTLGDIEKIGSSDLSSLYIAAAFRLVQRGDLASDLDALPISTATTISVRG